MAGDEGRAVRVRGRVERKDPRLPRYVVVPAEKIEAWTLTVTTTVTGTLNGVDMGRRSLKPWDAARWFMDLPQTLCAAAGVETGDAAELLLERASEDLPEELAAAIAGSERGRLAWEAMTPAQRRMLREEVAAAKNPETRRRRAETRLGAGG